MVILIVDLSLNPLQCIPITPQTTLTATFTLPSDPRTYALHDVFVLPSEPPLSDPQVYWDIPMKRIEDNLFHIIFRMYSKRVHNHWSTILCIYNTVANALLGKGWQNRRREVKVVKKGRYELWIGRMCFTVMLAILCL